jgi:hypothetical protein
MQNVIVAAAMLCCVSGRMGARETGDFYWSAKLAPGQSIEIKTVQGSIHAEGSAGDRVEVIARKTSGYQDPSRTRVDVVEHPGGFTVCAVNSRSERGPDQSGCLPGPGRTSMSTEVEVDFVVRVPAGVHFVARTVNGKIDARALQGDLEAYTVNGDVELSTTGTAAADTVNGSIVASLAEQNPKCAQSSRRSVCPFTGAFHTINGNITLSMPSCVSASFHGSTTYGVVSSDFPLTVKAQSAGASVKGNLGHGGNELHLTTVNGSIHLRRKPGHAV